MADWDRGYPANVEYIKYVKNELSPAYLCYCLGLSGLAAPDVAVPFSYMELGSGFGLSVAGWAAQFPQARFHCVDYNAVQTNWTQALARNAGLDNLTVHCAAIGDMLEKDLPEFDFVVLHGVYSWVPESTRREIRAFLARFLKPGGCAYVSYNAMPGNKDMEALRRFIHDHQAHSGPKGHYAALEESLGLLRRLKACDAAFFRDSPAIASILAKWSGDDPDYLVGELMPNEHKAYYFNELYDEMAASGLGWTSSANLRHHLERLTMSGGMRELLEGMPDNAALRETAKDFYYNSAFRRDIFRKAGAEAATGESDAATVDEAAASSRNAATTATARFCLDVVRRPFPEKVTHPPLHLTLDKSLYEPVQNALAASVCGLEALAAATGLPQSAVAEAVAVLATLGWVQPALGPENAAARAAVARLNAALLGLDQSPRPLLSARGGWISDWEPPVFFWLAARIKGQDGQRAVEKALRACARENTDFSCPAADRDEARQSARDYMDRHGVDLEQFLQRHAWL